MFTEVSLTLLPETDKVVTIKYDFISSDDSLAFSMGEINIAEKKIEDYLTEGEKE